jgi:small subunit ribosomal protein S1
VQENQLTEEQQGGTMPPAEASAEAPSSEAPAGTVAVADEPATSPTLDTEAMADEAPVIATEPEPEPAPAEPAAVAPEAAVAAPAPELTASDAEMAPAAADDPELADAPAADPEMTAEPEMAAAPEKAAEPDVLPEVVAEPEMAPAPVAKAAPTGPEPTTMEELLAEQDTDIKSFKHGDVVEGTVVRIDKDEVLVDIGAKSEGVVSNRELFGRNTESQPALSIGDVVLVYVLQPESPEGHVVLSLRRAGLERKWRSMQEQFEAGVIIEAPVIDHNKGGLIVDCGIRGFVPISQIVDFPRRPQNDQPRDAAQEIAEKLQPFVGRKLRLKILEVNRKANRLILSEKVALYEERREKRDELFSSLQVGQKVTGHVRSIAPFGVFVDLGGIDGLVHKSELSWNKVNNPEGGYRVGEEVEAEVIDINHERGRISLSIRRLQPDPWHSTVADFKVGDIIDGTVTKLVNFGAFVRVRDGLEGLIHISELSNARVAHPGDVVHEGQSLKLRIISLDSERHRLGLSLKQAEEGAPARPVVEPSPMAEGAAAAPRADRPERAERGDRRPRPDRERTRAYSASDAVQEPEGGIDTTLAAAFAGVREQLARAEAGDEPEAAIADEPETIATEAEAEAEAPAAEAPAAEAEADLAEPEPVAEPAAETPDAAGAAEDEPAAVVDALAEAGAPPASDVPVEPERMASGELMAAAEPASELADAATTEEEQPAG